MSEKPWASGPREILEHGIELVRRDTDASRRLAFLSIDNAVELIVRTYLGLPKRVTGISLTKKQKEEIANSFPTMLERLDEVARIKIPDIDVAVVEWYHRLRNQLYHNGNGLTVERAKVETYAGIGIRLFESLFDETMTLKVAKGPFIVAAYFAACERLHRVLHEWYHYYDGSVFAGPITPLQLAKKKIIDRESAESIQNLMRLRNQLAHGTFEDESPSLTNAEVEEAQRLAGSLAAKLEEVRR